MSHRPVARWLALAGVLAAATPARAQIDVRMFQQPAVSGTHIAFVYAGDIWVVPKQGGMAVRLSSPRGISGAPSLVDGGVVTVPTFRMYDPKGAWFAEGHGVDPDIDVGEDPTALARGTDPQLERAIEEVTRALATFPSPPGRPAYEKRVP